MRGRFARSVFDGLDLDPDQIEQLAEDEQKLSAHHAIATERKRAETRSVLLAGSDARCMDRVESGLRKSAVGRLLTGVLTVPVDEAAVCRALVDRCIGIWDNMCRMCPCMCWLGSRATKITVPAPPHTGWSSSFLSNMPMRLRLRPGQGDMKEVGGRAAREIPPMTSRGTRGRPSSPNLSDERRTQGAGRSHLWKRRPFALCLQEGIRAWVRLGWRPPPCWWRKTGSVACRPSRGGDPQALSARRGRIAVPAMSLPSTAGTGHRGRGGRFQGRPACHMQEVRGQGKGCDDSRYRSRKLPPMLTPPLESYGVMKKVMRIS